ncbi:MAG: DMT family transporter [Proteobacteria bacterium]|nr:DMT family transporter [Pseudomonadota bacterium]
MSAAASSSAALHSSSVWTALAPAVFVVLWATGFVAARVALTGAPPLTFLALRFGVVAALMLVVSLAGNAPWPRRPAQYGHIAVAGLLIHGCYMGGVFTALFLGMPAGISALIVGLQPVLTAAVVGPLLGETVGTRAWAGLLLGMFGVAMVLGNRLDFDRATVGAVILSGVALLGITVGTLYQKRFGGGVDLRSGAVVQYAAASLAMLVLAAPLETMRIAWSAAFIAAFAWLAVVLSVGAVSLLYLLIRRGAAAKVVSLFYLVPPVTALIAWAMLGEALGPLALAGMAVTAVGVAIVQRT